VTPDPRDLFVALTTQIEAEKLAVAIRFGEQQTRMAVLKTRLDAMDKAAALLAACRGCGMSDLPLDGGGLCTYCAEEIDRRCAAQMAEDARALAAEDRQMSWTAAWTAGVAIGLAFFALLAVLLNVLPR
jgi:hypothetical protein